VDRPVTFASCNVCNDQAVRFRVLRCFQYWKSQTWTGDDWTLCVGSLQTFSILHWLAPRALFKHGRNQERKRTLGVEQQPVALAAHALVTAADPYSALTDHQQHRGVCLCDVRVPNTTNEAPRQCLICRSNSVRPDTSAHIRTSLSSSASSDRSAHLCLLGDFVHAAENRA
jgi:hypothetical protein